MKFGLSKLVPVGIGLLTFAGFVGSISGSLAWWAYSTRVAVSYQGTSVTTSEQLQIGLRISKSDPKADDIISALATYEVTEDTYIATSTDRYVFAKAGGGFSAEAMQTYLTTQGQYAIDELAPVTSKDYVEGQNLTLYESLIRGRADNSEAASHTKYVRIPFVFRILKLTATGSRDDFEADRPIYLSKVIAEASSESGASTVHEALRVHFNNGTVAEQFILNVGDNTTTEASEMYTPVAGILDLDKDGYYDTEGGEELLYGSYTGTATGKYTQSGDPASMSDINGVYADMEDGAAKDAILADDENASTFLAKHPNGKTCYFDYSGLTLGKAYYKTLDSIKPDDSHTILSGGRVLCTTANSTGNYIADLDTTIWLEGWDHAVIDEAVTHKFNLGLQFQIDLVS